MDRLINYAGQIPLETDLLNTNRNTMVAIAKLARAMFGTSTIVNGLSVGASSPAALTVDVQPGEIYSQQNLDSTAYSSLAADTTHQIVKQGIALDKVTLSCPAPGTTGFSINYLIQATLQETDGGATVLPFYNASNPSQAYSGPNNTGASSNTVRACAAVVSAKAGTAATTGTQTTPAPDAGYVGLAVVTVANGQSTITSGNISVYSGAPVLPAPLNTGRLLNVQVFTSSGTYTPTAGTNSVVVEVQGAGGAGGGTPACDASHAALGGGGGSGAYAKSRLTSGFSGATVTVGAGGTGVSNANGNAGGTSSFGSISAPGGGGGNVSPTSYSSFPAIAGYGSGGAIATGANIINAKGQCSIEAFLSGVSLGRSGAGAMSQFGGGGEPITGTSSSAGVAAASYGAGGSGSLTLASGAAAAGGNGANGVVIVWEYA